MKAKKSRTQHRFKVPSPSITRKTFNGHNVGWFWEECFRESVHLIWPVNSAQFNHYIKHMFGEDRTNESETWAGYHISFNTPNGSRQLIALRSEWTGSSEAIGYLAHECFHATHDIMVSRGEILSADHSEPFAYLLQSVVDRCIQLLTNKPV